MHPTCPCCANDFATNINAPASAVMIQCGHVVCRQCANSLITAHMPCPSRCSADAVQHGDVLPILFTYEQAGNVATASALISRRVKALRDELQASDEACVDAFVKISQVEPLVNVQRGRIKQHKEILEDLTKTRLQVDDLLQRCHSVLDEISAVQLLLAQRPHANGRPRKRALSLDTARDSGSMSDRPAKRRRSL